MNAAIRMGQRPGGSIGRGRSGCARAAFVLLLVMLAPRWAAAQTTLTGNVGFYEIHAIPSNAIRHRFDTLGTSVSCVDDITFQLLDCPYTYELVGTDDLGDPLIQSQLAYYPPFTELQHYGGHEHDQQTHPFYWIRSGATTPITVIGGAYQYETPLKVSGSTQFGISFATFAAPETAGSVWERVNIGVPPGYFCVGLCWTYYDSMFHDTYLVGYQGFDQLDPTPSPDKDYVVIRKPHPDPMHPDSEATWGQTYTIVQLELIANNYRQFTGDQLSVNDMSLTYGGIFDVKADTQDPKTGELLTWQPPHKGHRVGAAFDVNTHDGSGQQVMCDDGGVFDAAVMEFDGAAGVDPATMPTQIYCESGGRIHINAVDETLAGLAPQ